MRRRLTFVASRSAIPHARGRVGPAFATVVALGFVAACAQHDSPASDRSSAQDDGEKRDRSKTREVEDAATRRIGRGDAAEDAAPYSPRTPADDENGAADADAGGAPALDGPGATELEGAGTHEQADADSAWCAVHALLHRHCTRCHDGQGTAGTPIGLTHYEDLAAMSTRKPAQRVYERVRVRVHEESARAEGLDLMPPQGALTASELSLLDGWIAAGAPNGQGCPDASSPAPDALGPAWPPAECDEVYALLSHGPNGLDEPYVIEAGAELHPQLRYDAPWGDEEVQAIAFRPITDNPKVVHHWILYSGEGRFLAAWAPGGDGVRSMPPDVGMEMPVGPKSLRLDMHYFNTTGTEAEADRSGLEVCVLKKPNFREHTASVTMGFNSLQLIMVPAGAVNYESTGTCNVTTTEPVHVITAQPHAHSYGVHMKFKVTKADGSEIVMYDRPFSFEEQGVYPLEPEVVLNTGDVVTTTCTYTNPTTRDITLGINAGEEMCFNVAAYYPKGALSCGVINDLLIDTAVFVSGELL